VCTKLPVVQQQCLRGSAVWRRYLANHMVALSTAEAKFRAHVEDHTTLSVVVVKSESGSNSWKTERLKLKTILVIFERKARFTT
jgi:hypothetical protein